MLAREARKKKKKKTSIQSKNLEKERELDLCHFQGDEKLVAWVDILVIH